MEKLAIVAALALALQAKKPDCDLATLEPAKYCPKCAKALDPEGTKDGKCKADSSDLKDVQLCVKHHYQCGCGGGGCCKIDSTKPGKCKCGNPLKEREEPVKCLVGFRCIVCDAFALTKEDVKHDEGKHKTKPKKDLKRSCELSGTGLHTKG